MGTLQINGTTLHYDEAGTGQSLLFVHGMAGFAGVWADQMERLNDAFHTVAYDRRGHSRSARGDVSQESVELHADDAAALIRALDLAPVVLVGSSGGARISIDVLRRHPDLVRGAVLSEPPVFSVAPSIGNEFLGIVRPAVSKALESENPRSAVDDFFTLIDPTFWATASVERRAMYHANLSAMLADLQMPAYQLTTDDLARIYTPCLMIYGSASRTWFQDVAKIVAGAIPDCRLTELVGAGHATYATRPAEFAEAVREFVTHLDAPEGRILI